MENPTFGWYAEPVLGESKAILSLCNVCGGSMASAGYDNEDCPVCGSRYSYDEGVRIELTEAQYRTLNVHRDEWKGK